MVAHQDARHGPATPRDINRPREASSAVTAGKTRHSPRHAESRKRGNVRLSLHSETVPTYRASFPSIVLSDQHDQQRCWTKRPRARLWSHRCSSRHRVAAAGAARYSFRAYEWRGYVPTFKAIVVEKSDGGQKVSLTDFDEANLMEGDVTVRVEWSTVNYKD